MATDLEIVRQRLRAFAVERDWGKFHSPKNLVMALAAEVGELLQHFQWLTPEEASQIMEERKDDIRDEVADVFIYLVRLADILDIDLVEAANTKIEVNEARYPAELAKGSAKKYTELGDH